MPGRSVRWWAGRSGSGGGSGSRVGAAGGGLIVALVEHAAGHPTAAGGPANRRPARGAPLRLRGIRQYLVDDPEESRAVVRAYTGAGVSLSPRTREQAEEFFSGWDLVEPGVVPVSKWRTDGNPDDAAPASSRAGAFGGVAVKPA